MRARRAFRVILYGEGRKFFVPDAFDALIIQIHMNDLYLVGIKAFDIHTKTMVLACDRDAVYLKIFDRMIGPVMAEF